MHRWGSRCTHDTLFAPLPGGGWGGVLGQNSPKNLPALKDHLNAKFHPDLSSSLDFFREHTHQHCPLCIRLLYVISYLCCQHTFHSTLAYLSIFVIGFQIGKVNPKIHWQLQFVTTFLSFIHSF